MINPIRLDDDMKKRMIEAMDTTWQAIGPDTLRTLEEMTGENSISREEVVEQVLDASFLESYGEDEEAVELLRTFSYSDQLAIAEEAFPFDTYGW